MNANKIFQSYNYLFKIGRPSGIELDETGIYLKIDAHRERVRKVLRRGLRWARFLDKRLLVYAGDSNAVAADSRELMSEFNSLAVNVGTSGTRFFEWNGFLLDDEIASMMNDPRVTVVLNLGGNHVLANDMDDILKQAVKLRALLPHSKNINIPPLPPAVLDFLKGRNPNAASDIGKANNVIRTAWQNDVIDIAGAFDAAMKSGLDRATYAVCSVDGIHYAPWFLKRVLTPIIRTAVGD